MSTYSDTSRVAFERALQLVAGSLPHDVVQRLLRLMEEEQLHDSDLIRQAIERSPPEEASIDAD